MSTNSLLQGVHGHPLPVFTPLPVGDVNTDAAEHSNALKETSTFSSFFGAPKHAAGMRKDVYLFGSMLSARLITTWKLFSDRS